MARKFYIGDIVCRKGSSVIGTINKIDGSGMVSVQSFTFDMELIESDVHQDNLIRVLMNNDYTPEDVGSSLESLCKVERQNK